MVTKKEVLALGILGAVSFALLRKPTNTISKSSFPQTLSVLRPTIDFSNPLPFKTIEQQRKEFVPTFKTEFDQSPLIGSESSRRAIIQRFADKGFKIKESVQTKRGEVIKFIKKTPTNTFKPSLTKI